MTTWNYSEAFARNLGLISEEEQELLRTKRIAIAGMGGVGGEELITLVRMGFEDFTIADNDTFELANTNRQHGALVSQLGSPKADTMAEMARNINPNTKIRVIPEFITKTNIDSFLEGASLYVDAVDAFCIRERRLIFLRAAEKGIPVITAGPIGFSTAFLVFDPLGMSFDQYFGIKDDLDDIALFAHFIVGLTPKSTHRTYLDPAFIDLINQRGPSVSSACHLAAGVVGCYAVKLLLKRGPIFAAPYYHQFDPYLQVYMKNKLWFGGKNPAQRIRRKMLEKTLRAHGPT